MWGEGVELEAREHDKSAALQLEWRLCGRGAACSPKLRAPTSSRGWAFA
jgi:hypothetical protein